MNSMTSKANNLFVNGKIEEAQNLYLQSLDECGQDEKTYIFLMIARCQFALKQYLDALSSVSTIIAAGDNQAEFAHVIASYCCLEIGDDAGFEKHAKIAFQIQPDSPDALACYGNFLARKDDVENARLAFEKSLGLNPDWERTLVVCHAFLYGIYKQRKEYKRAYAHSLALFRLKKSLVLAAAVFQAYLAVYNNWIRLINVLIFVLVLFLKTQILLVVPLFLAGIPRLIDVGAAISEKKPKGIFFTVASSSFVFLMIYFMYLYCTW